MHFPLLTDIIIVFALSIAVVFIFRGIKLPPIVGFLLTGVLTGPHGLGLVTAVGEVEILAEIGIILLLFEIGIEFSLKRLLQIKKIVFVGGFLQVLFSILIAVLLATLLGIALQTAILIGFLLALSSTAIVLKVLQERSEMESPHGRMALGILIFQDLIIVPMMLFIPLLAGSEANVLSAVLILIVKAALIIGLAYLGAQYLVPFVLHQIAKLRSREIFLLTVVTLCFSVAWLTSSVGLSLSLGAFLAGLIVSESEYSQQALGFIVPFKDLFTSFFFISIGMLLNVPFAVENLLLILLLTIGVLFAKTVIGGLVTALSGFSFATMIVAGLAISQIGEFSFVLAKTGLSHGLLQNDFYQIFLATAILSMGLTPFLIGSAPALASAILQLAFVKKINQGRMQNELEMMKSTAVHLQNHLIIVGFGVTGQHIAQAAKAAAIPYLIIEMNPETVAAQKERGEPIFYGDATYDPVLQHANIASARVLVVAIPDPAATQRIIKISRQLNAAIYLIVRTRFLAEMEALYALGADEVIPEDFESTLEMFTRVLMNYQVPKSKIEALLANIRADGYKMFRTLAYQPSEVRDLHFDLMDMEIRALQVGEGAAIVGRSLADVNVRKKHGLNVLAIRREHAVTPNPHGDTEVHANDILIVMGLPEQIAIFVGEQTAPQRIE